MDKMKYSVDEIIDDVIKLEDLNSEELVYLKKEDLDFEVKENDILVLKDGKYQKDEKTKDERTKYLQEKLEQLLNSQFKWILFSWEEL